MSAGQPQVLRMVDGDGNELLVMSVNDILEARERGTTHNTIAAAFERLDEVHANRDRYVVCSVCGVLVETDSRGDVLDSSGRCDACRP